MFLYEHIFLNQASTTVVYFLKYKVCLLLNIEHCVQSAHLMHSDGPQNGARKGHLQTTQKWDNSFSMLLCYILVIAR